MLGRIRRSCSCYVVSYRPKMKVRMLGTLTTTRSVVVPVGTSGGTLSNVRRLSSVVRRVEPCGRGLRDIHYLMAVCAGSVSMVGKRRTLEGDGCSMFGARVERDGGMAT